MYQMGAPIATCMPKPTQIIVSCDPKFYWVRPVGYGKMCSLQFCSMCPTACMSRYLRMCWAFCLWCICMCAGCVQGAFSRLDPNGTFRSTVKARIPTGRLGEIAELSNLACYLVSDYSNWMTGSVSHTITRQFAFFSVPHIVRTIVLMLVRHNVVSKVSLISTLSWFISKMLGCDTC